MIQLAGKQKVMVVMKWIWGGLAILLLVGCKAVGVAETVNGGSATPVVVDTAVRIPTATAVQPTNTATLPTPETLPTATAVAPPNTSATQDLAISADQIQLFPIPNIYAGEKVTFQILAHVPPTVDPGAVSVHVLVDYVDVANGHLNDPNLAGDAVGLFEWVWDTTDEAGDHLVHVILDRYDAIETGDENRDNNQVALTVNIKPIEEQPLAERNAEWVVAETACCYLHVVSGTAAERDLAQLMERVETAVDQAIDRLDEEPLRKFDIYLVDRVLGQGGYASYSIVVSYLDRGYASSGFQQIITHEVVHLLDRQFAPQRITFLAEGLAVWVTGGHYKPEDLAERSAALIALGRYVPMAELIDNFYPVQHEIGYLQAAGFVGYLIEREGWSVFRDFYQNVNLEDAPTLSQAVDVNLQQYYGLTLAQVEADWLNYLTRQTASETAVQDLATTIRYFDIMRRYQQQYDPTAYFLTAWLPHPENVLANGNPADLTRHPQTELNIALEVMFTAADAALHSGDYHNANILLDSITRVLDNDGEFTDLLARHYLEVVQATAEAGYEVQRIELAGNRATAWATKGNSAYLNKLNLTLSGANWQLLN
jgi:hypothetical protein